MNGDAGVDPVQSGFEFRKKFARSDTIFRFPSEILNGKPLCKVTEQRDLSDPDNCNHVGDSVLCDRTNLCRDVFGMWSVRRGSGFVASNKSQTGGPIASGVDESQDQPG